MSAASSQLPDWYLHQEIPSLTTPKRVVQFVRERLRCDRVTLLIRRGASWKATEISGVAKIHRHSATIRSIEREAQTLLATHSEIAYPSPRAFSPEESAANDQLLDATNANTWMLLPIQEAISTEEDLLSNRHSESIPWAALLCERFEGTPFDLQTSDWPSLQPHVSIALSNWNYLRSISGLKLRRLVGRILGVRSRWIGIGLIVALVTFLVGIFQFEKTHWVEAKGRLQPASMRHLYSPAMATVSEIHVDHGSIVTKGEILLELQSSQLQQLHRELMGQIQVNQRQLRSLTAQQIQQANSALNSGDKSSSSYDSSASQPSEILKLQTSIENLQKQLELVAEELDQLKIRSPMDGMVSTWNVKEKLTQRPLRVGDWLLTVEPRDISDWKLELEVPQLAIGYFVSSAAAKDTPTPVRFRLGSAPEVEWQAQLNSIGSATQSSESGEVFLPAEAEVLSPIHSADWQSGVEVKAWIAAGKMSIAKSWFNEIEHWWHFRFRTYWDRVAGHHGATGGAGS